jgi:hypothetical protein
MKGKVCAKRESARLGGGKQVYMATLHGQTVQTGRGNTYISWSGHVGASKHGIDFIVFYRGGPGSPSPPFKVGTLGRLLIALDDVGVATVEVVDPVPGLVDCDVADVGVICLGPQEAGPDVLLDVVGNPHGLLEGEQAVAGGEGGSDLGDIGQVADGGGLGVLVVIVAEGQVGDDLGGIVDPGVLGGVDAGAAGASADGGGVRDHAVPSEPVGAPRADGVVGEGVFQLVLEAVPSRGRERGGHTGGGCCCQGWVGGRGGRRGTGWGRGGGGPGGCIV